MFARNGVLGLVTAVAIGCGSLVASRADSREDVVQFRLSYEEQLPAKPPQRQRPPGIEGGGGITGAIDTHVTKPIEDVAASAGSGGTQGGTAGAELLISIAPILNPAPPAAKSGVTLTVREDGWRVDQSMAADSRRQVEAERSDVLKKLQTWSATLTEAQAGQIRRDGSIKLPVESPFADLKKLSRPVVAVAISGPKILQVNLDDVNDRVRKARLDELLKPIEEIEKHMTEDELALDKLRKRHEDIGTELDTASAELEAAQRKLKVTAGDIGYFGPDELKAAITKVTDTVARLKKELAQYDEAGSFKPFSKEERDEKAALVKAGEDMLARMNAGVIDVEDGKNPLFSDFLNRNLKQFVAATAAVAQATERKQQLLDERERLEEQIHDAVEALAGRRKDLSDRRAELFEKAGTSLQQIDVSVAGESVFRAVFSAHDAEQLQAMRDLNDRVVAEWPLFERALREKKTAEKAFKTEWKATKKAADKLSGVFGAIMVNAYANAATTPIDVLAAGYKGGLYGILQETLGKASEAAIKFVASGGQETGYEYKGVDEHKIEERVSQPPPQTASPPLRVDDLRLRAGAWVTSKVADAAEDKAKGIIPETVIEHAVKCGVEGSLQKDFRSHGKDIDSVRERLLKYLEDANKPGAMDNLTNINRNAAFNRLAKDLKDAAVSGAVKAGLKLALTSAGRAREEAAWENYFKHEIQLRVMYEIYRRFNEIYREEDAILGPLVMARDKRAMAPVCDRKDAFRIVVDKRFPEAAVARDVAVVLKASNDVDVGKFGVEVERAAATFAQPDRYGGTLQPGSPADKKVHVKVTTP